MKQLTFTLLLCLVSLTASAQLKHTLNFSGTLTGVPAKGNRTLLVEFYFGGDWHPGDTFSLKGNNTFRYKLNNYQPGQCRLRLWGTLKDYVDFIYPADYTDTVLIMRGDVADMKKRTVQFSGSPENEAYNKLLAINARMKADAQLKGANFDALMINANKGFTQLATTYPFTFTGEVLTKIYYNAVRAEKTEYLKQYPKEEDFLREKWLSFINFMDKRNLRHTGFKDVLDLYYNSCYAQNTAAGNIDYIKHVMWYAELNEEVGNYLYVHLLKKFSSEKDESSTEYLLANYTRGCTDDEVEISPKKMVTALSNARPGNVAHEILLPTTTGLPESLTALSAKNKVTLIFFWRSGCDHCHAFIPDLEKLYAKYHAKGLEVLGVSIDKNSADWVADLQAHTPPWPNVWADRTARTDIGIYYPVFGTPTLIAVGQDGKIMSRLINHLTIEAYLKTIFP